MNEEDESMATVYGKIKWVRTPENPARGEPTTKEISLRIHDTINLLEAVNNASELAAEGYTETITMKWSVEPRPLVLYEREVHLSQNTYPAKLIALKEGSRFMAVPADEVFVASLWAFLNP